MLPDTDDSLDKDDNKIAKYTRHYTDEQKIAVLKFKQSGLTSRQISDITGINYRAVWSIINRKQNWKLIETDKFDDKLTDLPIDELIKSFILKGSILSDESMSPDKIDSASLLQLMTASKISIDTARLLSDIQSNRPDDILKQYEESVLTDSELDSVSDEILLLKSRLSDMASKDHTDSRKDIIF